MTHWRYHLGVHKTATTHLQRVLLSQRKKLLAEGIDFIPHEELRAATDPILRRFGLKKLRFECAVRSPSPVAILSEENWIGHPHDACSLPIYGNLEARLKIVSRPNATAFIAIRNPADFAASVFSQALRHKPERVSLEATREAFLSSGSPWLSLVGRIREFFPNLYVWRYEDYRGNEGTYVSKLAGTPVTVPHLDDPLETKRLPAETIDEIERIRASGLEIPKADLLNFPTKPSRFEMFNEQERRNLTKAYDREADDLDRKGILIR